MNGWLWIMRAPCGVPSSCWLKSKEITSLNFHGSARANRRRKEEKQRAQDIKPRKTHRNPLPPKIPSLRRTPRSLAKKSGLLKSQRSKHLLIRKKERKEKKRKKEGTRIQIEGERRKVALVARQDTKRAEEREAPKWFGARVKFKNDRMKRSKSVICFSRGGELPAWLTIFFLARALGQNSPSSSPAPLAALSSSWQEPESTHGWWLASFAFSLLAPSSLPLRASRVQ